MDANELAERVARHMIAAEGTGPAWDLRIEEVREDYARVSMVVRADMLNGHGFAHGGMIFALADSAFAYVCNGANHASMAAVSSLTKGMVRLFIEARITPDMPSSRRGISKRTAPSR